MKLFLILITFFAFTVNAQESKPSFRNKINLELDHNYLMYSYQWFNTNPNNDKWITDKSNFLSSNISILFRNNYLNGGIKVHFFNLRMIQPTLGFNTLFALNNEKFYLGPFVSYGHTFGENDFKAKQAFNVGLEAYLFSIHLSASYANYFDYKISPYEINKNMHGFNYQLGKSVSLFSTQTDKRKTVKNIYLEANVGVVQYRYELWDEYFTSDVGINFRNQRYKMGGEYSFSLEHNHFLNFVAGVNLLHVKPKLYLGPYVRNGINLSEIGIDGKMFAEFGFETYFKNIHLTGGFARYFRIENPKPGYELTSLNLMLGYALPLGKRVKEN